LKSFGYLSETSCERREVVDRTRACRWGIGRWDDVKVIGRAVVLVIMGASQEFLVVHVLQLRCLDGTVDVKGVRDPMIGRS
jgi:hypothetical protein